MANVIDYVELPVDDLEQAKAFYAKALGWAFNDYGPDYAGIKDPSKPGQEFGGLNPRVPRPAARACSRWCARTMSTARWRACSKPAVASRSSCTSIPVDGGSPSLTRRATSSGSTSPPSRRLACPGIG